MREARESRHDRREVREAVVTRKDRASRLASYVSAAEERARSPGGQLARRENERSEAERSGTEWNGTEERGGGYVGTLIVGG